jgi:hypothetical protein
MMAFLPLAGAPDGADHGPMVPAPMLKDSAHERSAALRGLGSSPILRPHRQLLAALWAARRPRQGVRSVARPARQPSVGGLTV